jgi:hypothetical protein
MDRVSKDALLKVLEAFDELAPRAMVLVAVGGTAMTLLGLKASTKDIDFNIPSHEDYAEFTRLYNRIKPGVTIDRWERNMVFSEVLPDDYIKRASHYDSGFHKLVIKVLDPIDIVCSKISRFEEPDMEDIRECIGKCGLTKSAIKKRALGYERAGSDEMFNKNLEYVIGNMF